MSIIWQDEGQASRCRCAVPSLNIHAAIVPMRTASGYTRAASGIARAASVISGAAGVW